MVIKLKDIDSLYDKTVLNLEDISVSVNVTYASVNDNLNLQNQLWKNL